MSGNKHTGFSALRRIVSACCADIPDPRQAGKVRFAIHECCLSALAMMFFQDPSILIFQKRLQDTLQQNNL